MQVSIQAAKEGAWAADISPPAWSLKHSIAYNAVPFEMYEVPSDCGQDRAVDVVVAAAEVEVEVVVNWVLLVPVAEEEAEELVVLLELLPAVSIVALIAYTLSLFGPPQSSVLLPPQTMLQSVAVARVLLGMKEFPQKH